MKIKALFYQNPTGFFACLALLTFAAVSLFFNRQTSLMFFAVFLIVLAFSAVFAIFNLRFTEKSVSELNALLASQNGLVDFPMPCFICDRTGNVIWYNSLFSNAVLDGKDKGWLTFGDFFSGKTIDELDGVAVENASYADKLFSAFLMPFEAKIGDVTCVYLCDDTYFKLTEDKFNQSRPFVMQIVVDNVDQLSRQLTDSRFALISSGIEEKIEAWLSQYPVILKKTSSGRFVVIGEKKDLDILQSEKFSVLAAVRGYKFEGISVDATLSIGVGTGDNFAECEERAKKALDMSLGRGGDQAAVYTPTGHIYYGGVSNRMNDNSRVSPRQTSANILNLLKKHDKVIIEGHKFSDFDALGASVGMEYFARSNDIEAYVVLDEKTTLATPLVKYLKSNGFDSFISVEKAVSLCDDKTALIVVDTHREILLDAKELFEKSGEQVVIDHHRRSDDFLTNAEIFYHLPSSSSASEMVSELIEYSASTQKIPKYISTALLSGIVLDTRDYVLRTSQRTFEAAGFLRDNGADTVQVKKLFADSASEINLKNDIVLRAVLKDGFMFSYADKYTPETRVIISKAANDMLNIEGVKASFVAALLSEKGPIQISARSLGEENVQLIMENLGGGGHSTMAAAIVEASTIDEARIMLQNAINDYLLSK